MKQRRVAGLAVDTLSLDHGPSKDFKVHYASHGCRQGAGGWRMS
jgi:hypothetical protein